MDGVVTRRRTEYNDRLHLAHYTAQFTRAKDLPRLSDFYIDVDERPSQGTNKTKMHDPDDGLRSWAILLGTDEQRKKICL